MAAVEASDKQMEESYDEAEHVDTQYQYLLKNKEKGISFEEYCRRRGIKI